MLLANIKTLSTLTKGFQMHLNLKNETKIDPKELEKELEDLREELEHFQIEKERVRAIVGKIGGIPKLTTKMANWIFAVIIALTLGISFFAGEELRMVLVEMAMVALTIKIIYLIHSLMKVNHFKFWMLSSIEWRLNEINKQVKELKQAAESKTEIYTQPQ
jgi:regulator of replication initiation timing